MERITMNNYESLFLAYYQNELSPEEIHDLYSFLLQHPELGEVFEEMEDALHFKSKSGMNAEHLTENEPKKHCPDIPYHLLVLPEFMRN
jgi:hypothetical protein